MKVVFDSNIFISALIFPSGEAAKAVLKILNGADTLLISREIINEVLSVLSSKFDRNREALSRVAVYLAELGVITPATRKLNILEDGPDNRILECAAVGDADAIVTGDKAMLRFGRYKNARIISLREYLEDQ